MNPVLLKPGSDTPQPGHRARPAPARSAPPSTEHASRLLNVALDSLASCGPSSTWSSARAQAARRRSTCGTPTSPTWAWPGPPGCRSSWSATSTGAACSPPCTGRSRCWSPGDQALISGFIINKFRGDPELLAPGLGMLTGLTGRPVLGVLPWRGGLGLDMEDSLALDAAGPGGESHIRPPQGNDMLRVCVVRTPRISNFTDVDALATEPGVLVRFAASPAELADADLVDAARDPGHRRRSRLAARAGAGRRRSLSGPGGGSRCWASAAATRCWPGRSTTRSSPARASSPAWDCCRSG